MKPEEVFQEQASATTGPQEEQQVKPPEGSQGQAGATTGSQEEQQVKLEMYRSSCQGGSMQ